MGLHGRWLLSTGACAFEVPDGPGPPVNCVAPMDSYCCFEHCYVCLNEMSWMLSSGVENSSKVHAVWDHHHSGWDHCHDMGDHGHAVLQLVLHGHWKHLGTLEGLCVYLQGRRCFGDIQGVSGLSHLASIFL